MKLNLKTSLMAVVMSAGSLAVTNAQNIDCGALAAQAKTQIEATPAKVLSIVSGLVSQNPSCACDVVHTAIAITRASDELAAEIARAAIQAAPDQADRVASCVKPEVAAMLGSKSSKRVADSKDSNVDAKNAPVSAPDQVASEAFNPLELPGGNLASAPAVGGVGAPSSAVAGPAPGVAGTFPRGPGSQVGTASTFPMVMTGVLIPMTTAPVSVSATGNGVTAGDGKVVTESSL